MNDFFEEVSAFIYATDQDSDKKTGIDSECIIVNAVTSTFQIDS